MRSAECGISVKGRSPSDPSTDTPHSAFRIPHSALSCPDHALAHLARNLDRPPHPHGARDRPRHRQHHLHLDPGRKAAGRRPAASPHRRPHPGHGDAHSPAALPDRHHALHAPALQRVRARVLRTGRDSPPGGPVPPVEEHPRDSRQARRRGGTPERGGRRHVRGRHRADRAARHRLLARLGDHRRRYGPPGRRDDHGHRPRGARHAHGGRHDQRLRPPSPDAQDARAVLPAAHRRHAHRRWPRPAYLKRLRLLRDGLLGVRRVAQPAPRPQGRPRAPQGADHPVTRCGVVALAGRPNVGKSTLLNALVGEHLAIVSPKPQSTRLPVVGLLTKDDTQYIFTDSPGLLEPEYRLHEVMRAAALRAIADAEVIAYLHPLSEYPAPPLARVAGLERTPGAPVVTVYTKADMVRPSARPAVRPSEVFTSATTGEGIDTFLGEIASRLPQSPFHYDPAELATQPMRFFAAEFIREAAFEQLHEELPYSVACEIDEFREGAEPVYIRAVLYVERDSQKGIVIGEGGRSIKALGAAARA